MRYVLANSEAVANDLRSEGVINKKIIKIYNGVQISNQNGLDKNNLDLLCLKKDTIRLVVVANLIHYKGHQDLLRAMSNIKLVINKNWQLIFVGRDDGIKYNLVQSATELGIKDKVKFLGTVNNINKIWKIADISILPSHEEGFSNSILEGMANEVPTIATNVGGNPEIIVDGKNGFLVEKKSPYLLGQAILKLINDSNLRNNIGKEAKRNVVKNSI